MTDEIRIDVIDSALDGEVLEQDAIALREELRELDAVQQATSAPGGPVPEQAKAGGVVELTSLIVAIPPALGAVTTVIGALRAWLRRRSDSGERPATMLRITMNGQTLELTATAQQQSELVDRFLDSVSSTPAPGG